MRTLRSCWRDRTARRRSSSLSWWSWSSSGRPGSKCIRMRSSAASSSIRYRQRNGPPVPQQHQEPRKSRTISRRRRKSCRRERKKQRNSGLILRRRQSRRRSPAEQTGRIGRPPQALHCWQHRRTGLNRRRSWRQKYGKRQNNIRHGIDPVRHG